MQTAAARKTIQLYLGRYEVVHLLGEGGMGRVYFGRQIDSGRPVVIKVMHQAIAAEPRFRQRFEREILTMKRFRHPHAVALYEASLDDPRKPCLVMEYVPGVTLEDLLRRHGRLTSGRVGRLLGQLCWVLQAAHNAGIIHRDLSAANLMVVDADTPAEKLVVLDFGLAQMGAGPYIALEKLTGSGHNVGPGTPDYLCPEQIRGDTVDHRGDLYSTGVLLFQLLTGRLPFGDVTEAADILLAHAERTPPSFAEVGAPVAATLAVEAVVQSCLAKFPHERPQSARELAERFELALGLRIIEWEDEAVEEADRPALEEPPSRPDPNAVVDEFEAWMPERIAVVKLRGFVHDMDGEVIESVPGLVRVRLPIAGAVVAPPARGLWSFFSVRREPPRQCYLLADLSMAKRHADHYLLQVSVELRPERDTEPVPDDVWRPFAARICHEIRAYLINVR